MISNSYSRGCTWRYIHINPIRHGDTLCLRQILLFVVGTSGILRNGLKKFFVWKILFYEVFLKNVFTWSNDVQISPKKLNLLVIYCFFFFCFRHNNDWLTEYINCTNFNSSKWFLVNKCYYLIYIISRRGYRNDVIVTSCDTQQTRKQVNNGDKGYMLPWILKFHWYIIYSFVT